MTSPAPAPAPADPPVGVAVNSTAPPLRPDYAAAVEAIAPAVPPAPAGSIALPSGGWAKIRTEDDVTSADRRIVLSAFPKADSDYGQPVAIYDMLRAVEQVMIEAWYLPYVPGAPLPSENPLMLDRLKIKDENVLANALAPLLELFNPSAIDPTDVDNPDSPTGPSGA